MCTLKPLVSVYIANHNYGRYIEQAITSVLEQTLQSFEIIIIDDGSKDGSSEIIERYGTHEKIMAVFQQNKGLTATNNIAIRAASGKYIMRLDADDYLDPHALEVMSGFLERNPDVGLVFSDYFHVDKDGEVLEMVRRHNFDDVSLYDQPAHGACTMIRRDCLRSIDGYDESFRCQDGWDLWVRFIQHYNVQNVNLPLFYYRQHGSNLTRNEKMLLDTRAEILKKAALSAERRLKCVAVIPARGKATDPHSQALRPLGGKPLVDWTIKAAIEAKTVSAIIFSSPDLELREHVQQRFGSEVVVVARDWKKALPNSSLDETLTEAMNAYPKADRNYDALATLFIESPFRSARYIDMALDVMAMFDSQRVIGVRPETDTFYRHNGKGLRPLNQSRLLKLEKEELFRQVGNFNVLRRGHFLKDSMSAGEKVGHIVLDRMAAISLNTEWDWDVADAYIKSSTSN